MSLLGEADKVETLEFKWGKKRRMGGKKKEIQFYESFTYDGVDYSLHDCVYMHQEGEPEPYIGKLVKIWANGDKAKKIKIHWFFHASEILNWLGDEGALANEIFLASGEGVGATNINPLEAIAGKCNVVCISKDSRNPQPSEQELQMADYIFYRTFDVGHCAISDKLDDKVAGLEVKFIFNWKEGENNGGDPKLDSDEKEEPEEFKTGRTDGSSNHLVERGSEVVKDLLVESESLPEAKPASGAALDSDDVATTSGQQGTITGDKGTRHGIDSDKNEIKKSEVRVEHVEDEDNVKFAKDSGAVKNNQSRKTENKPSKEMENRNINSKLTVCGSDAKALVTTTTSSGRKPKTGPTKDFLESDKGVKSAKDTGALDDRPSKKARFDSSVKISQNKNNIGLQKLSINSDGNNGKELAATLTSGGKPKAEVSSLWPDKDPKQKTDGKTTKLSNGKLVKVSLRNSDIEDTKTEGETFEVPRRPKDVTDLWFKPLPWEERMKNAQDQGTLVQLSNLDPDCTSEEVEDIISHAFKENCTARMVPCSAISSPHSGQAFIILKTRGAAERIVEELDGGCLMLSNRSPLLGSIVPPCSGQKKSAFVGHLSIDINKHQMQREWKEALSTSHCSQPNNIEYEMAVEWCVLQSRSELCWKRFYKQQGEELRKLRANLKLK